MVVDSVWVRCSNVGPYQDLAMACAAQVKVEGNYYSGVWGRCTGAGMALPHLLKRGEEGVNGIVQDNGHTCSFCMNFKILP